MTVDNLEAVCPNFNCDYEYIAEPSFITTSTYNGRDVTITGQNLPTTSEVTICISGICCLPGTYSLTPTLATCTLEDDIVAGTWEIKYLSAAGLVNNDDVDTYIQPIGPLTVTSETDCNP